MISQKIHFANLGDYAIWFSELRTTSEEPSTYGSFIFDDLDAGQPIYGFDATFKVRIGGGTSTPADGLSLSVGPGLIDTSLFGEGGAGGGLSFDWEV